MQINAARIFQNPPHLNQPYPHKAQKRRQILPPADPAPLFAIAPQPADNEINQFVHARLVVLDIIHPFRLHIIAPSPPILKPRPRRQTLRRRVKILPLIKRRIRSDKINRPAIHPLQKRQVIALKQSSVLEVLSRHRICVPYFMRFALQLYHTNECAVAKFRAFPKEYAYPEPSSRSSPTKPSSRPSNPPITAPLCAPNAADARQPPLSNPAITIACPG